ncbi:hypothetical protein [Azohydromonas lata]|uniref:Uncharacterized protein n=1 Tax=Azohydromonas lata TaxID=45677 RepID=A0ABU5I7Z0_9BURK|nr:hypothetical protein [Azohydromonas lata]MDZ5455215.1 hypothetical protein [Azohydromonas lata]
MNSTSLLSAIGMLAIAAAASTASLAYAGLGLLNEPAMPQALQPTGRALTAMNTGWVSRDTDRHNGHRRDHERDRPMHPTAAAKLGMQAVPTSTGPGEPAHGWRYYTDAPAGRAVVISPQGEYFLSRGEGLRLVAVTQSVH